ncbi:hypothetical protein TWF694_007539 [Orbilia ellipsospora]|uniref:Uncharacterized protein n=1 Tax=Orbilia ellipsospora TaxID=2528407 RepID=A0AAV9XI09_9PEZI
MGFPQFLSLFLLFTQVFSFEPSGSPADRHEQKRVVLLPIRTRDLYPNLYLNKRDGGLSALDPKDKLSLEFGAIISHSVLQRAQVTIYKPDDKHLLLALEDFDKLTNSVSCKSNEIALKFKTPEAVKYAAEKWQKTIQGGKSIYLITHPDHKTCHKNTKGMERTAFAIKGLKEDTGKLTITLTKQAATWKQVARNMDINFATLEKPRSASAGKQKQHVIKRNEIDGPKPYENRVAKVKREINARDTDEEQTLFNSLKQSVVQMFPEAALVPLDVGSSDRTKKIRIITSDNFKKDTEFFTADCVGCHAEGHLMVNTTAKVREGVRTVTDISVETKVKGRLGIELNVRGSLTYDFNIVNTFFKAAIPLSGIPGMAEVDPQFIPGPGFRAYGSFEGKIDFGFDFDVDIHQSFKIEGADENKKPDDPVTNKLDIKPFADASLVANATLEPYFRVGLGMGISVLDETASAGFFAGYQLIAPVTLGLSATTTEAGTCQGNGKASVFIDTKVIFQDGWRLGVKVKGGEMLEVLYKFFNLGFFETWHNIKEVRVFNKCVSLGEEFEKAKQFLSEQIKKVGATPRVKKPQNVKYRFTSRGLIAVPAYEG